MSALAGPSALECHRAYGCEAVRALSVSARSLDGGRLALTFELDAPLARLRIPKEEPLRRAHELWLHTCFEAFVRVAGEVRYWEFNFAPSRAWAVYRFAAYREGMEVVEDAETPQILVRRAPSHLTLEATVAVRDLTAGAASPLHLRLGAAAVLEEDNGRLSYWALRHPPSKPDFHHPDGFVLELGL
ncbi:MAG TPA: DOMON-like domain-containing protein [Steroidobacteraceae bacterium]